MKKVVKKVDLVYIDLHYPWHVKARLCAFTHPREMQGQCTQVAERTDWQPGVMERGVGVKMGFQTVLCVMRVRVSE